jgi:hypothetical protein
MLATVSSNLLQQTTALEWVGPLVLYASEVRRVPAGIPGVYLLHAAAPAFGGYATFYVGKSLDLRRRLLRHLGQRTAKPSIRAARELDWAYWSAAPVLDTGLLDAIEGGLIRALRPVCNNQVPRAAPMLVNLPPLYLLTTFLEE